MMSLIPPSPRSERSTACSRTSSDVLGAAIRKRPSIVDDGCFGESDLIEASRLSEITFLRISGTVNFCHPPRHLNDDVARARLHVPPIDIDSALPIVASSGHSERRSRAASQTFTVPRGSRQAALEQKIALVSAEKLTS
jgi:hypothetical protein